MRLRGSRLEHLQIHSAVPLRRNNVSVKVQPSETAAPCPTLRCNAAGYIADETGCEISPRRGLDAYSARPCTYVTLRSIAASPLVRNPSYSAHRLQVGRQPIAENAQKKVDKGICQRGAVRIGNDIAICLQSPQA